MRHRVLVLGDRKDDECMPDRMRAAAEEIKPARAALPGQNAFWEVRCVEDEASSVRIKTWYYWAYVDR